LCQQPDCPLAPNANANVTASITSENFCAQISTQVDITGTLGSYSSDTYQTSRQLFLVDQISYFEAVISSTQATLTNVAIESVTLINQANSSDIYVLYLNQAPTAQFADSVSISATSFADHARFSFNLNSTIFNNGVDTTNSFTVQAKVDVTYAGAGGLKRMLLQGTTSNNRQVFASTSIEMEIAQLASSSSFTTCSFVVAMALLMFLMFL